MKVNKKIKIGIVNAGFRMGGAEKVTIELANSLANKNDIYLIDFSGQNYFFYELHPKIHIEKVIPQLSIQRKGIRKLFKICYETFGKSFNPLSIYKNQVDSLLRYVRDQNIEKLILSQGELTSFIPYLKSKLSNVKIIAWQHNSYDVYMNNYYKPILPYYKKGIQQADCVVCLTENDRDNFSKLNKNSICIYNPLTIVEPVISDLEYKNIVFVGRMAMEQKGLDFIIQLAEKLDSEWKIHVAGDGEDMQRFLNMINEASLNEKVIIHGSLKPDDLKNLYAKGSIFISTSRWEGFGLVITEAMASGLPVISFNNIGPAEILSHGEHGIILDKYDIEGFSKELKMLTISKEKRKYWQNKSLERVNDFQKANIIEKWEKQLQSL